MVFKDGDQWLMSTQVVKKYIKPANTQVPAEVVIPEPAAPALLQQQLISMLAAAAPAQAVEAAVVPAAAAQLLVSSCRAV